MVLVIRIWIIEFCFGFRASDFGFTAFLQLAEKLQSRNLNGSALQYMDSLNMTSIPTEFKVINPPANPSAVC
jgi:hypothetical protein